MSLETVRPEVNSYFQHKDLETLQALKPFVVDMLETKTEFLIPPPRRESRQPRRVYSEDEIPPARGLYSEDEEKSATRQTFEKNDRFSLSTVMAVTQLPQDNRNRKYHRILKYFQEAGLLDYIETTSPKRGRGNPCEIWFHPLYFFHAFAALDDVFSRRVQNLAFKVLTWRMIITQQETARLQEMNDCLETEKEVVTNGVVQTIKSILNLNDSFTPPEKVLVKRVKLAVRYHIRYEPSGRPDIKGRCVFKSKAHEEVAVTVIKSFRDRGQPSIASYYSKR
jgi:hypothetical protein